MSGECAHPRCNHEVSIDTLACRKHWFLLPANLRAQIWRTWKARQANPGNPSAIDAHESAKTAAVLYWSSVAA